jgi:hypothetical protein
VQHSVCAGTQDQIIEFSRILQASWCPEGSIYTTEKEN